VVTVGVSGDAKAEEMWRPAGQPYPMPPMKTFRNGQVWLKGFEAVGIRMVPAAVGMNSTEYKGMAPRSPGGCGPWAFATGRSRRAHHGRTVMLNG
jgi:hypothetical protein